MRHVKKDNWRSWLRCVVLSMAVILAGAASGHAAASEESAGVSLPADAAAAGPAEDTGAADNPFAAMDLEELMSLRLTTATLTGTTRTGVPVRSRSSIGR